MNALVDSVADANKVELADECERPEAHSGQFLTFLLENEEFGIDILKIRELNGIMEVTNVPQTRPFVEGVINLRGKVIPVIDLRTKFGLPRVAHDEQTCVIVVDVGNLMGIIVDTVCEVHDISPDQIAPAPSLGCGVDTSFIMGLGKVGDAVKILLDIDAVLNSEELVELTSVG